MSTFDNTTTQNKRYISHERFMATVTLKVPPLSVQNMLL